jgi:hypothetical protein
MANQEGVSASPMISTTGSRPKPLAGGGPLERNAKGLPTFRQRHRCAKIAMRFVPVKSVEQQSMLCVHRLREGLKAERVACINRIRGLLAEFARTLVPRARAGSQDSWIRFFRVSRSSTTNQRTRIDLICLGQHAHRLGEVACLARVHARHREPRALQRAHQAALVAAGGLDDHQIDVGGLQHRGQLVPARRIVGHTARFAAHASVQVLLADIDARVGPGAHRYPTLQMHVHDRQLSGLHGCNGTGRCVDLGLTRELDTHRLIGFGAPTANAHRSCTAVDKWTVRAALEPRR